MSISERMKAFLKTIPNAKGKLGMSEGEFEKKAGLANGAVSGWGEGLNSKTIQKITNTSPELNIIWLLHGEGNMLTDATNILHEGDVEYKPPDMEKELLRKRVKDLEKIIGLLEREIEETKNAEPPEKAKTA